MHRKARDPPRSCSIRGWERQDRKGRADHGDQRALRGAPTAAAAAARDSDYIPASLQTQILASSKLLGPGEMDSINFTAPSEPGNYTFLCSFPAHMFAGMRGIMTVE